MINRILVAYDGSDPAKKAYDFALDLAQKYQAEIWVLAVSRLPDFAEDVETEAILEQSSKYHHRLLAQLKQQSAGTKLSIHFEGAVGHPAEQIIRHAEQHGANLIVTGHRGKSLFERWRLGSISQRVLQYAHCPVLVVR
ncbi:MAG: universal stress protein [Betaproteobacteria bacterium]|nr:universal stress protein [Betaproteobacteria bacterium]